MNHIIHSCTHAHVAKDRPEISRTEMFAGMAAYLQQLLDLLEPRWGGLKQPVGSRGLVF